jgi:hypothetical protein
MSSITCSACSAGVGLGVAERTLDIYGVVLCIECGVDIGKRLTLTKELAEVKKMRRGDLFAI